MNAGHDGPERTSRIRCAPHQRPTGPLLPVQAGCAGNDDALCETRAVSAAPKRGRSAETPIEQVIARLDKAQLVEVISTATERHGDVERVVRLVAARSDGDLAALRTAVDQGPRTRRFLDYRDGMAVRMPRGRSSPSWTRWPSMRRQ